jgi:hypothetical protein
MSRGKVGNDNSTYSSYTRQSCNFVFPNINSKLDGEQRPRPGKFRITEQEAVIIDEGKDEERKNTLMPRKNVLLTIPLINLSLSPAVELEALDEAIRNTIISAFQQCEFDFVRG